MRLKQYSRRLREGLAVLQRDPMKGAYFDVTFAVQEGLAQTEHDKEAVKVCFIILLSSLSLSFLLYWNVQF